MSDWEVEATARQMALDLYEEWDGERCACGARRSNLPGWTHYCELGHDWNGGTMDETMEPIYCKVDGCFNEALATRGRYAYLCETHKGEARESAGFSVIGDDGVRRPAVRDEDGNVTTVDDSMPPRVPVMVIDQDGTREGVLTSDKHGDLIEMAYELGVPAGDYEVLRLAAAVAEAQIEFQAAKALLRQRIEELRDGVVFTENHD